MFYIQYHFYIKHMQQFYIWTIQLFSGFYYYEREKEIDITSIVRNIPYTKIHFLCQLEFFFVFLGSYWRGIFQFKMNKKMRHATKLSTLNWLLFIIQKSLLNIHSFLYDVIWRKRANIIEWIWYITVNRFSNYKERYD